MKHFLVIIVALLSLAYLAALGISLYAQFLCSDMAVTEQWLGERAEIVGSHTLPNGGHEWLFKADEAVIRDILRTLHAEPTATDSVYQPSLTLILTDKKGEHDFKGYDVRIERFQGGHVQMEWTPHDENAFEYIPVYLPTQPNEVHHMLSGFSLFVMILGPAIPVDAALLLLMPFGSRRGTLWYLLPLVHAGVIGCVGFLSALQAGEPFMCIIALILALCWCPVSLLQSLLFGGAVRLCRALSRKQETPKLPQVPS